MDLFDKKQIKPMLLSEANEPFDSEDYLFELKLDGIRCIAYLDKESTELINKRSLILTKAFPELQIIHKQVKEKCILDGELIVMNNGVPDFSEVKRRALMKNQFRIEMIANKLPASFTAYDILYLKDKQVMDLPLFERKKLLQNNIRENERLAISRYLERNGISLYNLAEQNELEGIVAKQKDSKYFLNKTSKDWIKIKYLQDDDFVVCGYIIKEKGIVSIVLGQFRKREMIYKGHVTLGVSGNDFKMISKHEKVINPPFEAPPGNQNAVWIKPDLVCMVKYMQKTEGGGLRQPVYKGLRDDKLARDCIEKN